MLAKIYQTMGLFVIPLLLVHAQVTKPINVKLGPLQILGADPISIYGVKFVPEKAQ